MKFNQNLSISALLVISALFIFLNSSFAQHYKKPPRIPDEDQINKMIDKMSEEVDLSDVQKSNIHDLYTDHFDELREIIEVKREERKSDIEEMDNHRKAFEDKIRSMLDEDQKEKFGEFMKKQKLHKKHDRKKHHFND